jgi:predicted ATPase
MLGQLSIQNYRIFSHFELDNIALVNLIVGSNNSGKSSLLEAIYLLTSDNATDSLFHILDVRGEVITDIPVDKWRRNGYPLAHLFHGHLLESSKSIQIVGTFLERESNSSQKLSLGIALADGRTGEGQEPEQESKTALVLEHTTADSTAIQSRFPLQHGNLFLRSGTLTFVARQSRLVTLNYLAYEEFALLWDRITLTPKEDQVIKALQLVEPNVERISLTSRQTSSSGVLLKLHKEPTPVPLASCGDGMRRILAIIAELVSVEGGTLLIDEIDTGLYYEVLIDLWKLVLEIAAKTKTQVFATTHSWDCVQAFQEALTELSDRQIGQLVRLDRDKKQVEPVVYSASELDIAMRQRIEVR